MATLILRATKGIPLTNDELDGNLTNLNNDIATRLLAADYTAADVLSKLLTVDGVGSALDADLVRGLSSTSAATANTVVVRDASGNFSANIITATLNGNATNVSGVVSVSNGGTGAINAAGAQANLQVDPAGTAIAMAIALG